MNGSLLAAGVVDEIVVYVAPSILGDSARAMFALHEFKDLDERIELKVTDCRQVGADLRITAAVKGA